MPKVDAVNQCLFSEKNLLTCSCSCIELRKRMIHVETIKVTNANEILIRMKKITEEIVSTEHIEKKVK